MAGIFLLVQLLILGMQFPPTECKSQTTTCTITVPPHFPYKHHQSGDVIIGAIASQFNCTFNEISFSKHPKTKLVDKPVLISKNYQHVLALVFAVMEINENPRILPNTSLGFHIYDSYLNARLTHQNTLKLLCTDERMISLTLSVQSYAANIPKQSWWTNLCKTLVFAVKEINENPKILSNASLGFHIYDSYLNAGMTHQNSLKLFCTDERMIPNFKCDKQQNPIAVIGALDSETSLHMATQLSIYKIPQIAYCASAPVMNVKMQLPSFYRMVPNEVHQYRGIVHLLQHFHWTWVGIIAMHSEQGEFFLQTMIKMLMKHGICTAFSKRLLPFYLDAAREALAHLQETNVITDPLMLEIKSLFNSGVIVHVLNADVEATTYLKWMIGLYSMFENKAGAYSGKVWIMTAEWDFSAMRVHRDLDIHFFHGALSFAIQSNEVLGFAEFLQSLHPLTQKGDDFIKIFWGQAFDCLFPNSDGDKENMNICTGQERLEKLPGTLFEMSMTGQSYSVYNAVHAVAHALQKMSSVRPKLRAMMDKCGPSLPHLQCTLLHPFLRSISFNNTAGDAVSFDEEGELVGGFDLINWVTFPNQSISRVKVGMMNPQAPTDKEFTINEEAITWHSTFKQVLPIAVCNYHCSPGYSRKKKEGQPFCCYDCEPCPEGEISDQEDLGACFKCPEGHFPNRNKDQCLQKDINFLSFTEPLGMALSVLALTFSVITALVFGIFIKNQNTPIVKANNRDLTYSLLASLLLCFLCALLFIGRPQAVTCYLRQPSFGLVFSVAVSCVLAKTITVVLAFMATKPGSRMRKWVGKRVANSIVLFCFLIQACICAVWLCTAPPFPDPSENSVEGSVSQTRGSLERISLEMI